MYTIFQGITDWITKAWDGLVNSGMIIVIAILLGFILFFVIVGKIGKTGRRKKTVIPHTDNTGTDVVKIVNEIVAPYLQSFEQKLKNDDEAHHDLRMKNQLLDEQVNKLLSEIKTIKTKTASEKTKNESLIVGNVNIVSLKEIIDQLAKDHKNLKHDYSALKHDYSALNEKYQLLYKNDQELNDKIMKYQNPMTAEELYKKGYEAQKKGKDFYDEALAHYKSSIDLKPNNISIHFNMGIVYFEKGNYDQAIQSCKKVIELNPEHTNAHNLMRVAYSKKTS